MPPVPAGLSPHPPAAGPRTVVGAGGWGRHRRGRRVGRGLRTGVLAVQLRYAWLSPIIGGILPGLASILYPLWYFSGTLAVIILRKPGAAVYVNLVGSAAEMLLGNQFSFGFASAALQGVFAELPFALTRYRVFNLPISMRPAPWWPWNTACT